jgi:hypothetical protein
MLLDVNYTYSFELISLKNIIIIVPPEDNLYLLCVKNPITNEYNYDIGTEFLKPKIYENLESYDKLSEGIVITLKSGDKIKKKTDLYIKRAYRLPLCIKKNQNINKILFNVIIESEIEEFCKYCPHYSNQINIINKKYNDILLNIKNLQEQIKNFNFSDKKQKALWIQNNIQKNLQTFMYRDSYCRDKIYELLFKK